MMLHSPQLQSLPYLSSPPPPMLLLPSGTPMCPISCHARYLGRIVYISQAYAFIRRDDPEGAALDDIFLYLKELERDPRARSRDDSRRDPRLGRLDRIVLQ